MLVSRSRRVGVVVALSWAALLAAWQVAWAIVRWPPAVFPAPSHVAQAFGALALAEAHAGFFAALATSLVRLAVGFVVAIALAAPLGFAMARVAVLDRMLGGLFLGLQTLPSVCWAPLAVLTFGLDERGILFVLVMGSAFGVAVSFRDGVRAISPRLVETGVMLGARRLTLYRKVIFPASLPAFVSSLRQGFSFAWRSLLGAELVVVLKRTGVGLLLHEARKDADVARVVALMVTMIAVGIVVDRLLFAPAERRIHARFGLARGA